MAAAAVSGLPSELYADAVDTVCHGPSTVVRVASSRSVFRSGSQFGLGKSNPTFKRLLFAILRDQDYPMHISTKGPPDASCLQGCRAAIVSVPEPYGMDQ